MLHRCIMIFPRFSNIDGIERIREQHDPLYNLVKPHITLVFPFKSDLTRDQLKEHIHHSISGSF